MLSWWWRWCDDGVSDIKHIKHLKVYLPQQSFIEQKQILRNIVHQVTEYVSTLSLCLHNSSSCLVTISVVRCVWVDRCGQHGGSSRWRWRIGSSRCHRGHNRAAGNPDMTAGGGCNGEVNAWPDPASARLLTSPAKHQENVQKQETDTLPAVDFKHVGKELKKRYSYWMYCIFK